MGAHPKGPHTRMIIRCLISRAAELVKVQRRAERFEAPLSHAAASLLLSRAPAGSEAAAHLLRLLASVAGWEGLASAVAAARPSVEQVAGGVRVTDGLVNCLLPGAQLSNSSVLSGKHPAPPSFLRAFVSIAVAAACGEPVLLHGPSCCKSEVVRAWRDVASAKLTTTHLSPGAAVLGCRPSAHGAHHALQAHTGC
jgi:hypothetical protein